MRLGNVGGITVNLEGSGVWVARLFSSFLFFIFPPSLPPFLPPSFLLSLISPLPVMRRGKELNL